MNQSYRPAVRVGSVFGSGQPKRRPLNGLVGTSYGNQCGIVKGGSDQLSALQLPSPSLKQPVVRRYNLSEQSNRYSQSKRLPDLNPVVKSPDSDHRDIRSRNNFHCASPISIDGEDDDDEFEAPSVHLPPSPGNADIVLLDSVEAGKSNGLSPHSPDSPEHCSPIPNGYLHFESTLFDSSDIKEEGDHCSKEDLAPFYSSPKSSQEQTVTANKITRSSEVDKRTYKPTLFNLMSKTISELNPTLSPSALPGITMRDGWSLSEESDSDGEVNSPIDPGLISPTGINSNVSLTAMEC